LALAAILIALGAVSVFEGYRHGVWWAYLIGALLIGSALRMTRLPPALAFALVVWVASFVTGVMLLVGGSYLAGPIVISGSLAMLPLPLALRLAVLAIVAGGGTEILVITAIWRPGDWLGYVVGLLLLGWTLVLCRSRSKPQLSGDSSRGSSSHST
jgi:hypothetical protein